MTKINKIQKKNDFILNVDRIDVNNHNENDFEDFSDILFILNDGYLNRKQRKTTPKTSKKQKQI